MSGILVPLLPHGRIDNVLYHAGIGFSEARLGASDVANRLREARDRDAPVVFPSHFFDHPEKESFLALSSETGARLTIQISVGAELNELFDEVLALAPNRFSLELILDRAVHEEDLRRLSKLEAAGIAFRYVFCPTREFDAIEAVGALPARIRSRLFFYFAPKKRPEDRFLAEDEIFLLAPRLEALRLPNGVRTLGYLRQHESDPGNGARADFRFSLDRELFRREFVKMGRLQRFRSWLRLWVKVPVLRLLIAVPFYLLWMARAPREAFLVILARIRGGFSRAGHRVYAIALRLFWDTRLFLIRAYWVLRVPFRKLYWVLDYQFRKRILRRLPTRTS